MGIISLSGAMSQPSIAATETPIYSFTGVPDANNPDYGVVQGPDGKLYGTTASGGAGGSGLGDGAIYQLTPPTKKHPSWQEKVIYSFTGGSKGQRPNGPLTFDAAGNAYGVAISGGDLTQCHNFGCGLVYMLSPPSDGKKKWRYKILHAFNSGDGSSPIGALTIDSNGNLYGATMYGGGDNFCTGDAGGCGVLYRLQPPAAGKNKWKFDVIYAMQHAFGAVPNGAVVFDATESALYGTTQGGGTSPLNGVAFQLKAPKRGKGAWTYTVLHNFLGVDQGDGGQPYAGLTFDANGNLYGTTQYGGSTNCGNGCGTVFELSQTGGSWNETIVHNFAGGSDGRNPLGGLTFDGTSLYGVTEYGGGSGCGIGCGMVFKMTLSPSAYSPLYKFQNGNDGTNPHNVTLQLRDDGLLYGTAQGGGPFQGVV
jgi:hypothetical protein